MKQLGQVGSEGVEQIVVWRLSKEGKSLTTLYSFSEAARTLGVHPQTVRNWIVSGDATPIYVGAISRRLYFDVAEVERLRAEVVKAE